MLYQRLHGRGVRVGKVEQLSCVFEWLGFNGMDLSARICVYQNWVQHSTASRRKGARDPTV